MFVKHSSWYRVYKSNPEKTYANAIFLGADEYWGSNNNGDAFTEQELIENHNTFVTHGKHYKHHENDDPSNNYGCVCESYYNDPVGRVEGYYRNYKQTVS